MLKEPRKDHGEAETVGVTLDNIEPAGKDLILAKQANVSVT